MAELKAAVARIRIIPVVLPEVQLAGDSMDIDKTSTNPWSNAPVLVLLAPAAMAMAWLVSKAGWFWNNRPDLQFGWVVVLLVAYLFWEAWPARPPVRCVWNCWAALSFAGGLALLLVVQGFWAVFGLNAASMCAMALGIELVIFGNLLFVFGWPGLKHFGFAFLFILVAMPMPSVLHHLVVGGLQNVVTFANVELLNLTGIPAARSGSLIRLPSGVVGVDEACSGVRSLQSALMATLFIGYASLRRGALRLVLLGVGVLLAVTGNLVRSFYLSWVASREGIAAIAAVHDSAGWSILLVTAVGVGLGAWRLSRWETLMDKPNVIKPAP